MLVAALEIASDISIIYAEGIQLHGGTLAHETLTGR